MDYATMLCSEERSHTVEVVDRRVPAAVFVRGQGTTVFSQGLDQAESEGDELAG
jgi:hypothetical protein